MRGLKFAIPISLMLWLLIFAAWAHSAVYYVDSSITDTNAASATPDFTTYNPTTFATDTGAASVFKTIADINAFSGLAAGDSVLFRKGQTWREQLTVPSSGESGNPITFGAYGSGAGPIISGSDLISSGWSATVDSEVTGNLLNETFNATSGNQFATAGSGYLDNTGWTGALGSGSVLNADNTDIADPLGGASQLLKVQKVSSNYNSNARWRSAGDNAISYLQVYVKITAEGLATTNTLNLVNAANTAFSSPYWIRLYKTGTTLKFRFALYNNGGVTPYDSSAINLDQWYKLEAYYDTTNQLWEWRIDGASINSGSLTGTYYTGPRDFTLGDAATSLTMTAYFDGLQVSTAQYPTVAYTYANVWKSSVTTEPKIVYFNGTRGTLVASKALVTSEYNWNWASNILYVWSPPDSDPAAYYTAPGIEAGARNYGVVQTNDKSYVTFDGLTVRDGNTSGVNVGSDYVTGIIFQNSTVERSMGNGFDVKGATTAHDVKIDNCLIQTNEKWGIWIDNQYTSGIISNTTITGNGWNSVLNNNEYSGIEGLFLGNFNIYGNTIYNTAPNGCKVSGTLGNYCHGIYVNESAISANIYNNTIYNNDYGDGIKMRGSTTAYKNTIYNNKANGIEIGGNATTDVVYNIYNNLIYSNNSSDLNSGIFEGSKGTGSIDLSITNNVIYQNSGTAQQEVTITDDVDSLTMKNNILWTTTTRRTFEYSAAASTGTRDIDYNLHWRADGAPNIRWLTNYPNWSQWQSTYSMDTHGVNADPLFISPATGDFHLQPDSPAIDAGTPIAGIHDQAGNTDFAGNRSPQRTNPSIGAYEKIRSVIRGIVMP